MADGPFGIGLRESLLRAGLTQAELAGAVGVSRATISEWMRGSSEPRPAVVFALEAALGVTPGHLSRRLGFLPADGHDRAVTDPVRIIDRLPDLSPESKAALVDVYRSLARADAQRAAITARARRRQTEARRPAASG